MEEKGLNRKVNILLCTTIFLWVICCFLAVKVFYLYENKTVTEELTVKRINIVDESGNLRMVLSNEQRQHPGIINGEQLPDREREPGIIFFNTAGDECGGLVFTGDREDAGMVLSFDQFGDDQIMQLQYIENKATKERSYGLRLWDYPKEGTYRERNLRMEELMSLTSDDERRKFMEQMNQDGLLMRDRLFMGKNFDNEVGLFIHDRSGIPRIKIYVDKEDMPRLEFINENGEITNRNNE